jgi:hypothetical protein
MAFVAKPFDDFRPDQACASDDDDLHNFSPGSTKSIEERMPGSCPEDFAAGLKDCCLFLAYSSKSRGGSGTRW